MTPDPKVPTMTEVIGQEILPATNQTGQWLTSKDSLGLAQITSLPDRLTDGMMDQLRAVISCPIPEIEAVTPDYLNKAMMAMLAVLPRQGKDAATGAMMIKQYVLKLGKHPKGAIDHLWSASIDRLRWFPTVAECNEIISEWVSRSQELKHAKSIAESKIAREKDLRLRDAIDLLRSGKAVQADVDSYPERWKALAAEQGYLWRLKDGSYLIRPDTMGMTEEELAAHRERVAKLREEGLL